MDKQALVVRPRSFHAMPFIWVNDQPESPRTVLRIVMKDAFNARYPLLAKEQSFAHGMTVTDAQPRFSTDLNLAGAKLFLSTWSLTKACHFNVVQPAVFNAAWGAQGSEMMIRPVIVNVAPVTLAELQNNALFVYRRGETLPEGVVRDPLVTLPFSSIGMSPEPVGPERVASKYVVAEDVMADIPFAGGFKKVNIKGLLLQWNLGDLFADKDLYRPLSVREAKALNAAIDCSLK